MGGGPGRAGGWEYAFLGGTTGGGAAYTIGLLSCDGDGEGCNRYGWLDDGLVGLVSLFLAPLDFAFPALWILLAPDLRIEMGSFSRGSATCLLMAHASTSKWPSLRYSMDTSSDAVVTQASQSCSDGPSVYLEAHILNQL